MKEVKKIGIEHSRTDMTEMKQTSKGNLQQNFTIPVLFIQMINRFNQ